jgi:hypothetical protein
MRQLFRKEYAKELEDTELSLETEPAESSFPQMTVQRPPTMPSSLGTPTDTVTKRLPISEPPQTPDPPAGTPPDDDKPRGFWGSLFKKRK